MDTLDTSSSDYADLKKADKAKGFQASLDLNEPSWLIIVR